MKVLKPLTIPLPSPTGSLHRLWWPSLSERSLHCAAFTVLPFLGRLHLWMVCALYPAAMTASAPAQDIALTLIQRYYAAFNAGDAAGMLALLTEDVRHDINEGETQLGVAAFTAFLNKMDAHYREQATDLVVMATPDGSRAAAEFVIHGEYLRTDPGLPEAAGQRYVLPVGAFFEVRQGEGQARIARVTNYYNLADWSRQVGG